MATSTQVDPVGDGTAAVISATLTTADHTMTGAPVSKYGQFAISATGTFGGATVAAEGSIDGTNYFALADNGGTDITFTAAGGSTVYGVAPYVRARLSTAGSGADIDVSIYALKTFDNRTN